jgi:hypothetical protein
MTRAGSCVLGGFASVLAVASAPAAEPLPSETRSAEQLAVFRDCRVAVFYQRDAETGTTLPASLVEALAQQINFVLYASLDRAPAGSIAEAERSIDFSERFMLDFARAIPENAERFADAETREATLLGCVAIVWSAAAAEIDALMAVRRRVFDRAFGGAFGGASGGASGGARPPAAAGE